MGRECSQPGELDHTELYSYGLPVTTGHHICLQVRPPLLSQHSTATFMGLHSSWHCNRHGTAIIVALQSLWHCSHCGTAKCHGTAVIVALQPSWQLQLSWHCNHCGTVVIIATQLAWHCLSDSGKPACCCIRRSGLDPRQVCLVHLTLAECS